MTKRPSWMEGKDECSLARWREGVGGRRKTEDDGNVRTRFYGNDDKQRRGFFFPFLRIFARWIIIKLDNNSFVARRFWLTVIVSRQIVLPSFPPKYEIFKRYRIFLLVLSSSRSPHKFSEFLRLTLLVRDKFKKKRTKHREEGEGTEDRHSDLYSPGRFRYDESISICSMRSAMI